MATREMPKPSFPTAAGQWFELSRTGVESDDQGDALEALDRLLLRHKPTSDLETIVLMEVIAEALRGGGRGDGLDVAALLNVRDHVLRESREAGLGESYAALQSRTPWPPAEERLAATG
jgi:hypothetical protein